MIAQAAHVPVHLGAMPASVRAALEVFPNSLRPGDIVILNDPYLGGTHLPDITMVAPVYSGEKGNQQLAGFVSARGHHADVGGMTPGSLPLSTELYQEGTIIPPIKLARGGRLNHDVVQLICRNSRTPDERKGDLARADCVHPASVSSGCGNCSSDTETRKPQSTWRPCWTTRSE